MQKTWSNFAGRLMARVAKAPGGRVLALFLMLNTGMTAWGDSSYVSSTLGLLTDSYGDPKGLTNRLTGVNWLSNTISGFFSLTGGTNLKATVAYQVVANTGEILSTLTITNPTSSAISVSPEFPLLSGISPGAALTYCFPQEGDLIHTNSGSSIRYYGVGFPLQFVDFYSSNAGGIYIMTEDQSNYSKTYSVYNSATTATNGVTYAAREVPPNGSWILKCVMGAHTGDWHAALTAYQNWAATWYNPISPRKPWFQNVYNLRDQFVFTNSLASPPMLDPASQQYVFGSYLLAQDQAAFGGDDLVHLFDWSTDPAYGRVLGDYNDWTNLVSASAFAGQITNLKASGIPVGLYFEGYLASKYSVVGQSNGSSWQMVNSAGSSYNNFGAGYYYMCADAPPWQNYLAETCSNVESVTAANGIYLDEFGFGYQYPCYNTNHDHEIPSRQLQAEALMMQQIRALLPTSTVTYTEARGSDVGSQYEDGSYSASVVQTINDGYDNPASVDLSRFALPSFKIFQNLFNNDQPFSDPASAQRGFEAAFFNGEGLYLEGPLNGVWYPGAIGPIISQSHALFRAYPDAFASSNPTPLVGTLNASIYANEFPGFNRTVWTLYNSSTNSVSGELLAVTNAGNSVYYDAWNGVALTPLITNNLAYLSLSLNPNGLGCVVQQIYYSSNVIAGNASGYWRLDEPVTTGRVATNLGSLGPSGNGTYATTGVAGGQTGAIGNDPDTSCAFNGTSGKVEVPYSSAWNSNTFTIEIWANSSNAIPSSYMAVMNSRINASFRGYTLYIDPTGTNAGQWQFWTGTGTNWNVLAGSIVSSNQWTHLAATYDGTNKCFYINGALVSSNVVKYSNNATATDPLRIGAGGDGTTTNYYFKGRLDEPAVYGYARSAQQVGADFYAGTLTNATPAPLVSPAIIVNPTNLTLLSGQSGALTVQAAGSMPMGYQWLLNGANLVGQTNPTLLFAGAEALADGSYQVVVTNSSGAVTSSVASLSVTSSRNGIYFSTINSNNPVGYWRLDELVTSGPTANNLGSLGAPGNGAYSPVGVTAGAFGAIIGDSDSAISLDGASGDVEVPYNADLNTNAFSVECWANPNTASPANYMAVVSSRNIGAFGGYTIYLAPAGKWQFWTGTGTNWDILAGPTAAGNTWTHLAGTFDGTNKFFYVNGALVSSNQVPFVGNASPTNLFRLGAGFDGALTNYYFGGSLDEVAVYNYSLTALQVTTDYNAGTDNGQEVVPNLVRLSPPPALNIEQCAGSVRLLWSGGTLQGADAVGGPYTDMTNATPPFVITNAAMQTRKFYRLKQ